MKFKTCKWRQKNRLKLTTVELADSTNEPPVIQASRKSVRVRTEHEMYRFWIDGDQSKTLIESDEPYIYDKFWKIENNDS